MRHALNIHHCPDWLVVLPAVFLFSFVFNCVRRRISDLYQCIAGQFYTVTVLHFYFYSHITAFQLKTATSVHKVYWSGI